MAMEIINEKPLSEIREEEERKKFEAQGDIFEVVAMIYEEVENSKVKIKALEEENTQLKSRIEILEGGAK